MNSYNSPSTKAIYRVTQVIWYILGVIETILIFRFALKMTGADPLAGFTAFVYRISWPLAQPFISVFRVSQVQSAGGAVVGVFEWTTLLAMFVYWIVAAGIIKLFLMGRSVSTPEAAARLKEQEDL